ncbi:hypothetical protein PVAP13_4KG146105 [Panicum virgatum]|uniref:Uncharacterized protein n=1 Tax=Panicum virgatum TaxID=38727 RepID=A0A8T0TRH0_PANVG|nr:hypothetical protein PVAP13_4KG146105 [Panicum virgatum]
MRAGLVGRRPPSAMRAAGAGHRWPGCHAGTAKDWGPARTGAMPDASGHRRARRGRGWGATATSMGRNGNDRCLAMAPVCAASLRTGGRRYWPCPAPLRRRPWVPPCRVRQADAAAARRIPTAVPWPDLSLAFAHGRTHPATNPPGYRVETCRRPARHRTETTTLAAAAPCGRTHATARSRRPRSKSSTTQRR